jgi:iron complex outermembrane receptor protein
MATSLHATVVAAQETTSAVTGQVVDPGDAAIVGAQIDVRTSNGAKVLHTTSDSQGRFMLRGLAGGSYVLDVLHDGFQETKQTLVLSGNGTEATRVQMPVSTLTQSVTVSASPALATELL